MMTPAQMDDLYSALTEADAGGDAEALAKIGWQLYAELGESRTAEENLRTRLAGIAAAARDEDGEPGTCPGCGDPGSAASCAFCGQPLDPGCGHGLDYTPASEKTPGRWRCTGCRAIIADEIRVPT